MKLTKMLGLAVVAALTSLALIGTASAMAESTALCTKAESPCAEANRMKPIAVATLSGAKAKLKSNVGTIECDALFGGEVTTAGLLGSPLTIVGHFKYSNCNLGCVVEEPNGNSSTLMVLMTASETAEVTGSGEVSVNCKLILFHCTFNGEGLNATAKGANASNAEMPKGEAFLIEQIVHPVRGTNCPLEAKLTINTGPETTKTFISS